jgi:hypothetical protein
MTGEWNPVILQELICKLVPRQLQPLLFDPAHHNTVWHQFSLMRHNFLVVEAAHRMLVLTGVDVVIPAIFHDLGKLLQFERAVNTGNYGFAGHEKLSVQIGQEHGLDCDALFLVRAHDISYQHRADRILPKLCGGNVEKLRHLLAIAACDTAGKGWTEAQHKQRPEVATKFQQICELANLDSSFAEVIRQACLEW